MRHLARCADIAEYQHRSDRAAIPVADRRRGVLDRESFAGAGDQHGVRAGLERAVVAQYPGDRILDGLARDFVIDGKDRRKRTATRLLRMPSRQALGHRVEVLDPAFDVGRDDAIRNRCEGHLRALLLAEQRFLGVLLHGDVADHADLPDMRAMLVIQRRNVGRDLEDAAIACHAPFLEGRRPVRA